MKISIKLIDSDKQIKGKIAKALMTDSKELMNKTIITLKQSLPNLIYNAIVNSPEYLSLTKGSLRLELGIPDAPTKIAGLLNIWISNFVYEYVKPTITGDNIKSTIKIFGIKSDYGDVLNTSDAYVIDKIRGYSLPWLEWLLLDGNKTIVPGYDVFLGPNPRSRTGFAVMKVSSNGWNISEFSGTQSNNWITRAIDGASTDIQNLLKKAIQ